MTLRIAVSKEWWKRDNQLKVDEKRIRDHYITLPPGPQGTLNETMDADHRARHVIQTSKLAIFIPTSLSVL